MATLDSLKQALWQKVKATTSCPEQPLSNKQYSAGFDILVGGSGWMTYQDFIIPQLSQLLAPFFNSHTHISVLEIGPGPKSILGYLPGHLRRMVRKYTCQADSGALGLILVFSGSFSVHLATVILWLGWRVWIFTIAPVLNPREPKLLPYWIPCKTLQTFPLLNDTNDNL
jgi:hypothetical protein